MRLNHEILQEIARQAKILTARDYVSKAVYCINLPVSHLPQRESHSLIPIRNSTGHIIGYTCFTRERKYREDEGKIVCYFMPETKTPITRREKYHTRTKPCSPASKNAESYAPTFRLSNEEDSGREI
ncbi:MAG: hypothetical protein KJ718_06235 [Nanoarchaeota archaeon]|nr:hypothetical protein [Nanoarchaeota archaeon]MBU1052119.1 hypothetical protein [Nanoarchaeota archaeon]MBU1987929.1 hypothetical protein [Nanoarchaeota archaeon]